jgi:GT2 family glycosyltransferase
MTSTTAIIVNYRTPELTNAATASVLADDPGANVVIVDNASGDGSVDRLRSAWRDHPVTVIDAGANLGYGAGVNRGALGCTSDALLILNSDARVVPGAITALKNALESGPRVGLAAPRVNLADGAAQVDAFGSFPTLVGMLLRTNRHPADVVSPDWVSGVCFLARRAAFEHVGGFDERYWMYFEDIDLCRRLRQARWSIQRVDGAVVEHLRGASRVTSRLQAAQYAASQERYLRTAGYSAGVVRTVGLLRKPVDRYRTRPATTR